MLLHSTINETSLDTPGSRFLFFYVNRVGGIPDILSRLLHPPGLTTSGHSPGVAPTLRVGMGWSLPLPERTFCGTGKYGVRPGWVLLSLLGEDFVLA